jgi:hypothetical protein
VLQDENILSAQCEHEDERKVILADIDNHQYLLSKARKLLLTEKIDYEDFIELKNENKYAIISLNNRLSDIKERLAYMACDTNIQILASNFNLLQCYRGSDFAGKRHIINLFTTILINQPDKLIGPLVLNDAIAKIVHESE